MEKNGKNDSPSQDAEGKTKDPFAASRHWRNMVFVSRYKNLRILDPKNLKRFDRTTGETVYGTEIVFKAVGNIGIYKPKTQREATILLGCPQVQLQGAPIVSGASDEVTTVVTAPHPQNVFSDKP